MHLILVRHGNTFNAGDSVTRVGRTEDIPLVEKGRHQAMEVADALLCNNISPTAIFSSPLKRTRETADIISKVLSLKAQPIIDERLNEIDYGKWAGLSNDEIIQRYGEMDLNAWDERSVWPKNAKWGGSEEQIIEDVVNFFNEVKSNFTEDDTILIISSNGVLRYFLKLVPDEFKKRIEDQTFKMKTGYISTIQVVHNQITIPVWNVHPKAFQHS